MNFLDELDRSKKIILWQFLTKFEVLELGSTEDRADPKSPF